MAWTLQNQSTVKNIAASTTPNFDFSGDFTATADRLLILAFAIDKACGTITAPTGWSVATSTSNTESSHALCYKKAAGGETSASPTMGNSEQVRGIVLEYSCADNNPTFDGAASNYNGTPGLTIGTGTASGLSSSETQLAVYSFGNDSGNGQTLQNYSGSLVEVAFDFSNTGGGDPGFAIAHDTSFSGTSTSGSCTLNFGGDENSGIVAVFYEGAAVGGANPKGPLGGLVFRGPFGGPI